MSSRGGRVASCSGLLVIRGRWLFVGGVWMGGRRSPWALVVSGWRGRRGPCGVVLGVVVVRGGQGPLSSEGLSLSVVRGRYP